MRRDPFRVLVHELRNPLAAAQGFADLLAEDERLPEDARAQAEIIRSRTREAGLLLAAVSDLFREPERHVSPGLSAAEAWRRWKSSSPFAQGIQWVEELDPEANLPISFERLRLLFNHLARNAARFAGPGPSVTVSAISGPNGTIFSFQDKGPGAASEILNSLGEPFSAFPSGKGVQPGAGLGLAHVKRLTEEAGGVLSISSEPGKGFCVSLTFPKEAERGQHG